MKVLIISAYPPESAPEANHALHISEHLAGAGHEIHVLCKKGSIDAPREGITVHPVMEDWSWSDLPVLIRTIKKCRPNVVLLLYIGWVFDHNPMITFLPTICRKLFADLPCVTQFENIDENRPNWSFLERSLRQVGAFWACGKSGRKDVNPVLGTLLRDSARVIALSSAHRDRLMKQYQQVKEKCTILPPPPLIRFCTDKPDVVRKQVRKTLGVEPDDFVVMYWGFIYPTKGLDTLLHAFRIACKENPNMRLVVVGDILEFPYEPISCSDYFKMVRQLPEKLGIAERVIWTGRFDWDSDTGSRYLHAADVCVLPLDYGVTLNNSSLAAACTHELPVIGTEIPGGRDDALEHGQNIYLCQPQDPKMMAEAIQVISKFDELREHLREGAIELARTWHSWDRMTERLIDVFKSEAGLEEVSEQDQNGSPAATSGSASPWESADVDTRPQRTVSEPLKLASTKSTSSRSIDGSITENEKAPLVSIILAVYNVEKYLSQCLDALANQTLQNIEIIAINDASTDNSLEIIKDYQSRYPNIRLVNCEKNIGLASVRNIGLREARGKYIGFADGDDWVNANMCEVMYQRITKDDSDVLISGGNVFYENSKTFAELWDIYWRQQLDLELKSFPFDISDEPSIIQFEPVAWTKIYKRSFLERNALNFESGMNSYEDMCFHFSVLIKAEKVSLIDDAFVYYRKDRPGQLTALKDRKTVFEVFAVFAKIQDNLVAWDVSSKVWAQLIRVQMRIFDWLLKDQVQSHDKRDFFACAAKQLKTIPKDGFESYSKHAYPEELSKLWCMRKKWLYGYEQVLQRRGPIGFLVHLACHDQPLWFLKSGFQRLSEGLRWRVASKFQSIGSKVLDFEGVKNQLHTLDYHLGQLEAAEPASDPQNEEPLVESHRIKDQTFFFLNWSVDSAVGDAVWRVENDFYLSQTAIFREGDTVVDIGAQVGVFSIYLAKKYPFITVYAIEPESKNYKCLLQNIELNNVTNVIAINKAIAGDTEKTKLYTDPWNSGWSTINVKVATKAQKPLKKVLIESLTLEQLFSEHSIEYCRLLKMHAEGAVDESLAAFTRRGCVDLLCGQADLTDCSRVRLESASWRIARQHFWRIHNSGVDGGAWSWMHQMPTKMECPPPESTAIGSYKKR